MSMFMLYSFIFIFRLSILLYSFLRNKLNFLYHCSISDLDLILLGVGVGALGTALNLILILRTMCQGKPSKCIVGIGSIFLFFGGR